MQLAAVIVALAFAVAIALVAFRLGRSRTSRPAQAVRVTAKEVMETDALLRRIGGLDEAERHEERKREALALRTAARRGAGPGPDGGLP